MCKECRKLWEIFAETQLECVKQNRIMSIVAVIKCSKCKKDIYIIADTTNDTIR